MAENQKKSVNFELENEYVEKIKEIAKKQDQSVDYIVRLCVIEGLRSMYGPIKM
ncbi:MAG: CopG family ribbon-helix-helix protein [Methanobacteriaceae archaeon]